MVICARCGTENPEGFRFCGQCAASLAEEEQPRQSRKMVTALFCDVTSSTALGEELDPEVLRWVLNRYFEAIRRTIERHGGTVEKFIGDAVMAVFGIPRVHEDDALRAVRAAAEIREQLPGLATEVGVELRFRTGVNTGSVLMGEGENLAIGDAVNVAARLEQAAEPGEIVLGEQTRALVRDAVRVEALKPLRLKGKSDPVAAFRLLSVDPPTAVFSRHLDLPLVGRGRELEVLRQAWTRAVQESRCHLLTLLGEAGVGKSRLVSELLSGIGDEANVLRGRCLHYGEGITFWPLVEALLPVGQRAQQVLEHLNSGAAAPEELFWGVRRLLESLAAERPVVLYLDDLQWAEPTLLDLIDHVADLSRGAPILLLCTARPELLDDRPAWGGGKLTATTVLLEPLAVDESETLLDVLGDGLDRETRMRVIAASEGNPLFLEEMVALAQERGTVEVPPTIQALLAARLERLAVEERELLERGAVEGEVFHRLAIKALAGERLAADVELRLSALVRKELIRPHPATLKGDDAFRFKHLLIRDAAYDGLPKASRADLHERFARWLEDAAPDLPELDEIVGWHLEQAVQYHGELGRDPDPELACSAAEHLYAAGKKASARSDLPAAANLLERALALAPQVDQMNASIAFDLAEQLVEAGEFTRAEELLAMAENDPDVNPLAVLTRLDVMHRTSTEGALEMIDDQLPNLFERFSQAGDPRGLAKAHMVSFERYWLATGATPAGDQARLGAAYAAEAGDESLRARAVNSYIVTLLWGPAPAEKIAQELYELEHQDHGPWTKAYLELARGALCRLEQDFPQAVALTERALESLDGLGMRILSASCAHHLARAHLSAGNTAAAVAALKRSDEIFAEYGERNYRSSTQANLARCYALLDDQSAALAACDLSDELSAEEDVINFAMTHSVRAHLALANGATQDAARWAESAVRYAFTTDRPTYQGEAKLELARVLTALGRRDEAIAAAREALAIHEAKGDRPGMAEARAMLREL